MGANSRTGHLHVCAVISVPAEHKVQQACYLTSDDFAPVVKFCAITDNQTWLCINLMEFYGFLTKKMLVCSLCISRNVFELSMILLSLQCCGFFFFNQALLFNGELNGNGYLTATLFIIIKPVVKSTKVQF